MAAGMESSDDEFGILQDERCTDTGRFQERYLLHELVQQPSAAAATRQPRHLASSRLERFEDRGPVRSGSLASCQDFESGCASDLMSLLLSQLLPGEPFVSRQQVSQVITVTRSKPMPWKRRRS